MPALDNLTPHKSEATPALITQAGAKVLLLVKTPDRTTAAAFRRYATGEVVADSGGVHVLPYGMLLPERLGLAINDIRK
jgi:hypothetical protein